MYLWGIHVSEHREAVSFSLLRKEQKQVKKNYRVEQLYTESWRNRADLALRIGTLYRDKRRATRKRLYSQDRRPTRSIRAYPTIVVCGLPPISAPVVETLRRKGIPVQSVYISEGGDWRRRDYGRALGHDYFVPLALMDRLAVAMCAEGRLSFGDELNTSGCGAEHRDDFHAMVLNASVACDTTVTERPYHVWPAVAAPVWFRETIRYRRAYQSR